MGNVMSTAELRKKEIINLCDGSRLGFACDFEFDKCTAQIIGLVLEKSNGFLGLGAGESVLIPWCNVQCIGEDTILVDFDSKGPFSCTNDRKNKKFVAFR